MSKKKLTKALLAHIDVLHTSFTDLLVKAETAFKDQMLTDADETLPAVKKFLSDTNSFLEVTIDSPAAKVTQHLLVGETTLGNVDLGAYKFRIFIVEHRINQPFVYLTPIFP